MNDRTYVCSHAPSLALLLFETACSSYNQKGLLIGSIRKHVVTSNTDEQEDLEEEKTVIYIEHCVPITDESVFGSYGELKESFFDTFYKHYKGKIVGWYSFRRNARKARCSLAENLIHRSLLSGIDNVEMDTFPLALLTASSQEAMSTHSFNQTFLRLNRRNTFEPIRFKIYNLSDKITNSSGYLQNMSFPSSEIFRFITATVSDESGVRWVKSIRSSVSQQLESLNQQLYQCEVQRERLQAEVDALRAELGMNTDPPVARYAPVPQKERLIARYLKYNLETRYGANRSDNPMLVSDDEVDEDCDQDKLKIQAITESFLQSEEVRARTSMVPHSYASALQRPFNSGSGDSASVSGAFSKPMEH